MREQLTTCLIAAAIVSDSYLYLGDYELQATYLSFTDITFVPFGPGIDMEFTLKSEFTFSYYEFDKPIAAPIVYYRQRLNDIHLYVSSYQKLSNPVAYFLSPTS